MRLEPKRFLQRKKKKSDPASGSGGDRLLVATFSRITVRPWMGAAKEEAGHDGNSKKEQTTASRCTAGDKRQFSSQFVFADTHVRRNMLLINTLHGDTAVSTTQDKKPQITLNHHKNKQGVDNFNKVL